MESDTDRSLSLSKAYIEWNFSLALEYLTCSEELENAGKQIEAALMRDRSESHFIAAAKASIAFEGFLPGTLKPDEIIEWVPHRSSSFGLNRDWN